jgi:type IV pilus assembly protein PilW
LDLIYQGPFANPLPKLAQPRSAGFSLVEVMVGMVIGMIGVTVMMQVFSVAEGHKRTTTGAGDATSNGAIALYAVQRDIRQGGNGSGSTMLLGCDVQLRAGVTLANMGPVTIGPAAIPGGDAGSDTVLVVYGDNSGVPEGDTITLWPASNTFSVAAPTSFAVGDRVIPRQRIRPSPCVLTMEPVVGVTAPSPPNVIVTTGPSVDPTGGRLFNLGPSPRVLAYAIRGGNLTRCDYGVNDCGSAANRNDTAIWAPIASNIVSMRAQYANSTTSPITFDQSTPTTCAGWLPIRAIRIALVARSDQHEKDIVTVRTPTWAGSASAPIDLSANPDWQRYRYKVFETLVPLRNMIPTGAPACN